MTVLKLGLLLFALFFLLPLGVSAALYLREGTGAGWRTADRSSVDSRWSAAFHACGEGCASRPTQ
jgi:hypothetical protein